MEHYEYTLVVEGAVDATVITDTAHRILQSDDAIVRTNLDNWLEALEDEARTTGVDYEVFRISHGDHPLNADCECAQYETSHLPIWRSKDEIADV